MSEEDKALAGLLTPGARIAVLGIKTHQQADQPSYDVPRYLQHAGFDVVPVPVYYPDVREILGVPVVRRVRAAAPIEGVVVFRKSSDIPQHLADLLDAKPRWVWFQLGIRNEDAAQALEKQGIRVVQDRCIAVEHRRLLHAGLWSAGGPTAAPRT